MKLADEIARIRRYLRDPSGNIWGNDLLVDLWNEVARDMQNRTSLLEDVRVVGAPPQFAMTYMHDWEAGYAGSGPLYRMPGQDGFFTHTHRWEVQQRAGITPDTTATGSAYTHPWEAWYGTTPAIPPWPMPREALNVKAMFFDHRPLSPVARRDIQRSDPTWETRTGTPLAWAPLDDVDHLFYVYPRPSTVGYNDAPGEGMVLSVSGEGINVEYGVIIQRTESVLSAEAGFTFTVLDSADNVLIVYDVAPGRLLSLGDDIVMPDWMAKYVRRGVLSRAYAANTDGRIVSLGAFWGARYEAGLSVLARYKMNRLRGRRVRLMTAHGPGESTNRKHPRLPDAYPAVNPR